LKNEQQIGLKNDFLACFVDKIFTFVSNLKKSKMKNVFKIAFALCLFMSFSNVSNAQESFGNAGLEIALPVGDWAKDVYGIGVGGSGGYEFGLSDNLAITANVGITFLSLNSNVSDFIKSSYLVPIQLGGRYYLTEAREGLFGELMVGMHLFGVSTEDIEILGTTIEGDSETEAYFSVAPQVGYFINENLSVALRYQLVFQGETEETITDGFGNSTNVTIDGQNLGYIGLKLAYNF